MSTYKKLKTKQWRVLKVHLQARDGELGWGIENQELTTEQRWNFKETTGKQNKRNPGNLPVIRTGTF